MSRRLAAILTVSLAIVAAAPGVAAAAKKPRSCTILKTAQMSEVLDADVTGPGEGGTAGLGCSFDINDGLGDPEGGIVIVTYYKGTLAKNVWSASKPMTDPIEGSKARFDPTIGTAYVFKKGKLVGVSVTYTGNIPTPEELIPQMTELVELAAKKL